MTKLNLVETLKTIKLIEKPPDLLSLFIICDKINDYLSQDISNVIVINSKGGEGRAGVVVCCYLLYIKKFQEPIDAFNYYSNKRLYQGEGVSQPCQKRYVNYFYNLLSKKLMNFPYRIKIVSITIKNMYEIYHQGYYLVEIHDFRSKEYREIDVSPNNYEIDSENKTLVLKMENLLEYDQYGDIIIKICYNEMFFVKKLGKISFNTAFLPKNEDEIIFHSNEIDPDTILNSNYKFSEDYEIQINFKKLCNSCPFKKPNKFCQECTKFFKTNKIAYDKFKEIKDNQQIYLEKNILYKKLILFGNIDSDDSDIILQKEEENIANKIKTPRNELKINQVNKNEKNFFNDDIENNSFDSDKEEYQDKTIKTDNENKKTDDPGSFDAAYGKYCHGTEPELAILLIRGGTGRPTAHVDQRTDGQADDTDGSTELRTLFYARGGRTTACQRMAVEERLQ